MSQHPVTCLTGGHLLGYRLRGPVDPHDEPGGRWRAERADRPGRLVHVTWLEVADDAPEREPLLARLARRRGPVPEGVLPITEVETDPAGVLVVAPPTAGGSLLNRTNLAGDAAPWEALGDLLRRRLDAAHRAGIRGLDIRAATVRFSAEGSPCFVGVSVRSEDATEDRDRAGLERLLGALEPPAAERTGQGQGPTESVGASAARARRSLLGRALLVTAVTVPLVVAAGDTAHLPAPTHGGTPAAPGTSMHGTGPGRTPVDVTDQLERAAGDRCPLPAVPAPPADVGWVRVDLLGDGCPRLVTWDGEQLTVHDASDEGDLRFQLTGQQGDRLTVVTAADGHGERLALHRPTSGTTYVFEQLATPGQDVTATVLPPDPTARPG